MVLAGIEMSLSEPAGLLEADLAVAGGRSFVEGIGIEPYAPEIQDVEAVVAEESERLGAVALAELLLGADEYAELGGAMHGLYGEEAAIAQKLVRTLLYDRVALLPRQGGEGLALALEADLRRAQGEEAGDRELVEPGCVALEVFEADGREVDALAGQLGKVLHRLSSLRSARPLGVSSILPRSLSSPSRMVKGWGGQPGMKRSTGTRDEGSVLRLGPPGVGPAGYGAGADGYDYLGLAEGVVGLLEGELHVLRHGARDEKPVGVAWRGDELEAEAGEVPAYGREDVRVGLAGGATACAHLAHFEGAAVEALEFLPELFG